MYSYKKIIHYGDTLELYEYEKRPAVARRAKRKHKSGYGGPVMAHDRGDLRQPVESPPVRLPKNARRAVVGFKRLVTANMGATQNLVFATFTFAENIGDLRLARKNFNIFARALKDKFGEHLSYLVVAEFQQRGAVHFHSLIWGLPVEVVERERFTRLVAGIWQHGFVDIRSVRSPQGIGLYLAKYLTKTFLDYRLKGMKAYIGSRNLIKPVEDKNAMLGPYYHGEGYQLSTARVVHEKEYMTQWLGKGRIRIYKQIKNIPHEN